MKKAFQLFNLYICTIVNCPAWQMDIIFSNLKQPTVLESARRPKDFKYGWMEINQQQIVKEL